MTDGGDEWITLLQAVDSTWNSMVSLKSGKVASNA